jgi:transcriptional regulator with XRE-family HTH domain
MNYFASNIKRLRLDYGLTQVELAKSLKVSVRTLRRWESGDRLPLISDVKKIIDKYYIDDVYELVYGPRKKAFIEIPKLYYI